MNRQHYMYGVDMQGNVRWSSTPWGGDHDIFFLGGFSDFANSAILDEWKEISQDQFNNIVRQNGGEANQGGTTVGPYTGSGVEPYQGHSVLDYVGLGVGAAGTYYGAKAEAFHNALYWVQKNGITRLTSTAKSNYTYQRSFNLIEEELSTVKAVSKYAGWAGVAVSGVQFINNRSYANAFDLAMSSTSFIPGVGWAISGAYFLGNAIDQVITGKSIGQQIFGDGHF